MTAILRDDGNATATLNADTDYPLGTVDGRVSLDEGGAPHVVGSLTAPLPDDAALLDQLDPRTLRRVTLEVTAERVDGFGSTVNRTFDLGLRSAQIDEDAATVTLTLESDEALLIDDVWLGDTSNTDALAYQSSLRAIIDNVVLDRIGAALEPGTTDTPFYVLFDARNLLENPGGDVNASAIVSAGNSSFARETVKVRTGAGSIRVANGVAGLYAVMLDSTTSATGGAHTVSEGDERNFSVWASCNVAHNAYIGIRWLDSSGNPIGSDVLATPVALAPSSWKRISVSGVAPAGAARMKPIVWGNAPTGGFLLYLDDMVLADTVELVDAFDGDTPDTLEYGYNWEGTPGVTRSSRTALIDRAPDLLHWKPGVSAWAFVQPIVQAAGFRLLCDEQRKWWLVDGAGYLAHGMTQLSFGAHITRASTGISRDGDWFDAALVRYRWRDPEGNQQERIDWFAAPGWTRARTFDIEAPYPGPGRAAYKVKRAEGLGRTATVEAPLDLTVTPSQALRLNLPNIPELFGVTRAVEFDLGTFRMSVESRGLTDVPSGAWILANPTLTWAAVDPGTTWAEATPDDSTIFD
ncbi:hypothetical protein [Agromyces laixinhei]|uniref:hypothetical protein n=1 Tax=Agromyces laixinhei TaxID=2585717 RepID=UPI0012EE13A3|nr:hypothetical protein [Agromyces laixinhei]